MSEFSNVIIKKYPHVGLPELGAALNAMRQWCRAETSLQSVELASDLFQKMKTSWYDGMLLASALHADCTHFLSEDQQHGRVIGSLTIINPFQAEPAQILKAQ